MRREGNGLIIWVSSSSCRGAPPLFLGPYFAGSAATDSLAVSYASELARGGIETSILVPGPFTKGTNHFASMGKPFNEAIAAEYDEGPYKGVIGQAVEGLAGLAPEDAGPAEVARAIVRIIKTPIRQRPFRVHIDPSNDRAEIVNGVADRVRAELFRRIGLEDLLHAKL